jgi:hypothetical protein
MTHRRLSGIPVRALSLCGLLWLLFFSACSDMLPGPFVDPVPDLMPPDIGPQNTHLTIQPATLPTIVLQSGSPQMRTFHAFQVNETTGQMTDVTDMCFWSVPQSTGQRLPLGTISQGVFTTAAEVAGSGQVQAELANLQASVPILIQLQGANHFAMTQDGENPPANAPSFFNGTTNDIKNTTILYPQDGSIIPQNLNALEVQYSGAGGDNVFDVFISGTLLELHIYTDSPKRLLLTEEEYNLLTDAGNYGTISVVVRGGTMADPSSYGQSPPARLTVTPPITAGTYYFATAKPGQGIWRYDWLSAPGTVAKGYATDQTTSQGGQCYGCHALSNDGSILTASTSNTSLSPGAIIDVQNGGRRSLNGTPLWSFSAVTAAADQAAVTGNGALSLLSIAQGTVAAPLQTAIGNGLLVQPSFSMDGNTLVYVQGAQVPGQSEAHVQTGSLMELVRQNGIFGAPTPLVSTSGSVNNYYPAITPDGKWVLFTRAQSDSYDNTAAQLYMVAIDGSVGPLPLTAANTAITTSNMAVGGYLTNSYPRVAPLPVTLGPQTLYYFTFSSRRQYGVEIQHNGTAPAGGTTTVLSPTAAKTTLTGWNDQLWMSTFDPAKAAAGQDPSSPAVWLPFQVATSSNHTATFTQTVFPHSL